MKILTLIFCLLLAGQCYANTPVRCKLVGEVKGLQTKALWLKKFNENIHVVIEDESLRIPVVNGKFTYEFTALHQEAYEFVLDEEIGSTRGLVFFPAHGTVELSIQLNRGFTFLLVAKGGELNSLYDQYRKSIPVSIVQEQERLAAVYDVLSKNNEFNSEAFKGLLSELKVAEDDDEKKSIIYKKLDEMEKTGVRYSEKGLIYKMLQDSLYNVSIKWKHDYVTKNQNIVSYYLIYDMVRFAGPNSMELEIVSEAFPMYSKKFPDHPYTTILSKRLEGLTLIKPGFRYIDFTAQTIEGVNQQISKVVIGKINLINFWGSWCGPCLVKSRKVVPLYETYKTKGFTVVGVAREFNNLNGLKSRLGKEQFNWLNLVELDDENKIWATYGVGNGAGLMLVLDHEGIILAVDPNTEELERILQEKL